MSKNKCADTFTPVLEECLFSCQADTIPAKLERMKASGIEPDILSFNLMIATYCSIGDLPKATKLLEEMIQNNVMPNGFTFRFLMECCNHKQTGDYTNALQFYNQALSFGIKKDSQITSLLLEVCKTAIRKSQDWRKAISIFATLHELNIGVNVEFMNTLLRGCLERPPKVFEIFVQMEGMGIDPTLGSYTLMIQSCISEGDVTKALEIFDVLKRSYHRTKDPSLKPNSALFEVLLEGCHRRVMPEKALEIMIIMEELGIELSTISLDHLINTMEMGNLWDSRIKKQAEIEERILTLDVLRPALEDRR